MMEEKIPVSDAFRLFIIDQTVPHINFNISEWNAETVEIWTENLVWQMAE